VQESWFGGRAADLLGRREVFAGGLALFALASLPGGLAQDELTLVAARAAQGLGGAIVAPATLSILTIGGSLGLALLATIATQRTAGLADDASRLEALTEGFQRAFAIALAGAFVLTNRPPRSA
jgi:MFS family permease